METFLEINLDNLQQNLRNLKSLVRPPTQMMAVVKSNAYGHGLVESAKAVSTAGANWLGVVYLEEAMVLRKAGIVKPILVLKSLPIQEIRQAANQDISVPIVSLDQAREVSETSFDKTLKVHLKVETGLNRFGLEVSEIEQVVNLLKTNRNIEIEGIYSHLASVEENDLSHAKIQIDNFKKAIKIVNDLGYENILKHIGATSATLLLPESHFDMVRCGIGLYGLWPSIENKESFGQEDFLAPVLCYKTYLSQIKKIAKGEKIGYGCTYEAKSNMTIGIIPVGYYEGVDRGLSNGGEVLISGSRCPIIGRICMNISIVDISNIDTNVGGEVVIIGKQNDQEITVDEIAEKLGTINYEIVSRLSEYIERRYI